MHGIRRLQYSSSEQEVCFRKYRLKIYKAEAPEPLPQLLQMQWILPGLHLHQGLSYPCTICLDHCCIYCVNIRCIHAMQYIIDRCIYIVDSFCNTFSKISALIAVTKLQCFKFSCRCAGRSGSSCNCAISQMDFSFYGRISSGIQDFSSDYFSILKFFTFFLL